MVSVANVASITESLRSFQKIGNFSGWILLSYTNSTTVSLTAKGTGSVDEFVHLLSDKEIQYIVVRIKDHNKDGMETPRDVFITWIGSGVKIIEKGQKSSHIGTVRKAVEPFHAELTATNRAHFNEATVRDRSAPLSGSHVID
eukprot:TRINITY_DN838_c0_g1_i1.p2 TRINITY_DN838_c0_g1~~TRINITY_DN838_c0_g1_i1.p2  ORF type:complete len:143 (-),score=49.65 TRINITY_DN838_c0_g1_i1:76-504(-)